MKMNLIALIVLVAVEAHAQTPNFAQIFREIKAAPSATESINIRQKYLPQMRDLNDFNRLTDLEALVPGEDYFDHYRKALGQFILNKVGPFMLDRYSDEEQDIFARKLVTKSFNPKIQLKMLELGLFYVDDCDDFKSFVRMAKAPNIFSARYQSGYCSSNPGGFGNTFELISNLTLVQGEYKVIYLPSMMYVSKLYVSVEGIRSDAYFDVMVNGDIKGTIYAPGKDPLYIINVADSTNTINLRSMFGDARISSIKVEFEKDISALY